MFSFSGTQPEMFGGCGWEFQLNLDVFYVIIEFFMNEFIWGDLNPKTGNMAMLLRSKVYAFLKVFTESRNYRPTGVC